MTGHPLSHLLSHCTNHDIPATTAAIRGKRSHGGQTKPFRLFIMITPAMYYTKPPRVFNRKLRISLVSGSIQEKSCRIKTGEVVLEKAA